MARKLPVKRLIPIMLILAIIGLIVITQWAGSVVNTMKQDVVSHAEKELRVPQYDSIVLTPLWIEHIQEQGFDKPVVGMFGASTVFGTTVKEAQNTPSGILQVHLKDKQVLNLGLSGGRLVETYAILASVIDKVDFVLYEINYGILPATDNDAAVAVYPTLMSKLNQNIPRAWLDGFSRKDKESVPSSVHNAVSTGVLNHWTLYHDRDALSYRFFKTRSTTEKMRREIQKARDAKQGVKETYIPPFRAFEKLKEDQQKNVVKHYKSLYTWEQPFDPNNSFGLFMMEKTLDLLEKHKKQAVFYTAPLDKQMIAEHNMLEWQDYHKVMGAYQTLIESRSYPFIEFNDEENNLIPHEYYHDASHLIDDGSTIFGEILYERLKTYGITDTQQGTRKQP
ncbi:hypothetical protein [Paenibacillus dakarensis]|uniref:hypothetical protein n=1 Tax=Paenibacillus dakarensis TaxID=1527293 RepID=UPI0006D56B90|nr:hypothetical protein [Paenibacillus dakarensis]